MARRPTKPAKLDAAAHTRLAKLKTALESQEVHGADYQDILSALVLFTTPEQLAGMVEGYRRYTRESVTTAEGRPEAGE